MRVVFDVVDKRMQLWTVEPLEQRKVATLQGTIRSMSVVKHNDKRAFSLDE